jgi:hypothetical protein
VISIMRYGLMDPTAYIIFGYLHVFKSKPFWPLSN